MDIPPPLPGREGERVAVHGLRCASPVATFRRPVGAKSDGRLVLGRRVRSVAARVILSLVLGVVTTYLVAWGLLNARLLSGPVPVQAAGVWTAADPGWTVCMSSRVGVVGLEVTGSYANPDSRGAYFNNAGWHGNPMTLPAWSLVDRVSPSELFQGWNSTNLARCIFWERAAGWPRIAVVEREVADPPGLWPTRQFGASIRVGGNGDAWSGVVFAVRPVWGGFVVDVGVFAVMWAGLLWGFGVLWRLLRTRDGRCPKCRYDLSGLTGGVCPECGAAVITK